MVFSRVQRARRWARHGTTVVEVAVTLPLFLVFLFGLIEYGHARMVANSLNSACRNGARYGSIDGISTSEAEARVTDTLASAVDTAHVTVTVKDASVFDSDGALPSTSVEYDALPNIELSGAEPRQFFLVRANISYNDIALLPLLYWDGIILSGQVLMRHE